MDPFTFASRLYNELPKPRGISCRYCTKRGCLHCILACQTVRSRYSVEETKSNFRSCIRTFDEVLASMYSLNAHILFMPEVWPRWLEEFDSAPISRQRVEVGLSSPP